ncbi:MAG: hypothetical protein U1F35_20575 [Steroidobacteraceae bacterium]
MRARFGSGSFEDAERLRRWSFLQRTPQQRLDWLVQALEVAYAAGAIKLASNPPEAAG